MKVLVGYKRVIDYTVHVRVKPDRSGIMTEGVKQIPNPFDDIALEQALRWREAGLVNEVVIVALAPVHDAPHLRSNGLAMGADRAIHVVTSTTTLSPLTVARALRQVVEREQPDLVVLGKQAIDDDANQVGQMLATLWQRPQATFASAITLTNTQARVVRELDTGTQTLEIQLPAVITTDLTLNEPRYIKLPDLMKAKQKPIDTIALADLGVDVTTSTTIEEYAPTPQRQRGLMVSSVEELIAVLQERGLLS